LKNLKPLIECHIPEDLKSQYITSNNIYNKSVSSALQAHTVLPKHCSCINNDSKVEMKLQHENTD
jgi:hypothetical protein